MSAAPTLERAAPADRAPPAARVVGLRKRFGPREVLHGVDLTVEARQVHALLGANGAGKSSVVKILAGYYAPDGGRIAIGGRDAPPSASVARMAALGVRVVHQDLGLIDGLSILENVAVGGGYVRRLGRIDWRATEARVAAALDLVGLPLAPREPVAGLPTWQRVAVACARALHDGLAVVRLLILDEVTAALPPGEVALILDIVRRLQALGAGILYVTHRFEEVIDVADWATVLRNGAVFESRPTGTMTAADLVESVVGHQVTGARRSASSRAVGRPILAVEAVTSGRLRGISLEVRSGEICGVIGRAGCGRSALGRTIFGLERVRSGTIALDGTPLVRADPAACMRRGVAYVPQDRQRAGVLPQASVRENLTIASLARVSRFGWIRGPRERSLAEELIELYGIVPADGEELVENLSGGNQQKAVVGRWASRNVKLFILDEPTEGVDAGARASLYRVIRERADAGAAVLLLSSSIEEIAETCDRALLMRDGALADEIGPDRMTVPEVERLLVAAA